MADVTIPNESDTIACEQCGKGFTPGSKKAKFCSNACKMQNNRNKRQGTIVTPTPGGVPENTGLDSEGAIVTHTPTDQAFIDREASRGRIDWYIFGKQVQDRRCECGKLFQTRLKLNRFCSPECMDRALTGRHV